MAAPREVIPIPKLRGLHDFPEVAPKGSAVEALNVEFTDGGPKRRRGTQTVFTIEAPGKEFEIHGKGVWSWTPTMDRSSMWSDEYIVVGYDIAQVRPIRGAGENRNPPGTTMSHLAVYTPGGQLVADFHLGKYAVNESYPNRHLFPAAAEEDGLDGMGDTGPRWERDTSARWDATTFTPAGMPYSEGHNVFVVATHATVGVRRRRSIRAGELGWADDALEPPPPHQETAQCLYGIYPAKAVNGPPWCMGQMQNGLMCSLVQPIDRDSAVSGRLIDPPGAERVEITTRYWGNGSHSAHIGVPSEFQGDDPGPYLGHKEPDQAFQPVVNNVVGDLNYDLLVLGGREQIDGRYVAAYAGRLFVGGMRDNSVRHSIRFSNLGDMEPGKRLGSAKDGAGPHGGRTTAIAQGWPTNNVISLVENDASSVTGMSTWRGNLVVFKKDSVTVLRGTNIEDMPVVEQNSSVGHTGLSQPVSVTTSEGEYIFFANSRGFYVWSGNAEYISGPIERRLRDHGGVKDCIIASHPDKNQVWFQVRGEEKVGDDKQARSSSTWFVLDLTRKQWSEFQFGGEFIDTAVVRSRSGNRARLFGLAQVPARAMQRAVQLELGEVDVLAVVQFDTDTNPGGDGAFVGKPKLKDGTRPSVPYVSRYETQRLAYGRFQPRIWRILRLAVEQANAVGPVRVYWCLDNQSRQAAIANGQHTDMSALPEGGADGDVFGQGVFGNALFDADAFRQFHQARIPMSGGKARWMRFGVESEMDGNGELGGVPLWHINAAEVDTRRGEGRR